MKEGWREFCIGDAAEVFTGFPFEGIKYNVNKGIKVIRGENVSIGRLRWDITKYWDNSIEEKYKLQEGDIVIGMDGSRVGKNKAQIRSKDLPLLLAQRVARLRSNKSFDQNYLSYIINNERFENYISIVKTGTTIPHISSKQINGFKFQAPVDKNEQSRIASILSSLDDKIELNIQMNKTLEAIAQAIFKEWFMDFRFSGFDGELLDGLPKGWRKDEFINHIIAERGLSYKGNGLTVEGDGIPMNNLNSVYEGGGYKYEGIKYYNGEYKERHFARPGDIIVANTEQGHKYLLIGYPAVVPGYYGETTIYSHHIYRVRPKSESNLTSQFIYYLLLQPNIRDQVVGCCNGTTVNMLKIDGLQRPVFIHPPLELIKKFSELVQGIWQRKETNFIANQTLTRIRDTLLPKLMTGKIKVA